MVDLTRRIEVECPNGSHGWGSGVILGPAPHAVGYMVVATASHVMHAGCDATIRGQAVVELSRDEKADVSLVLAPGFGHWYLQESRLWLGMPVVCVGWPFQPYDNEGHLQVSRGALLVNFGVRLKVSSEAFFGNSGGPVFDAEGRLVGLLVSGLISWNHPVEGEHYVTPARRVFEMYEALR